MALLYYSCSSSDGESGNQPMPPDENPNGENPCTSNAGTIRLQSLEDINAFLETYDSCETLNGSISVEFSPAAAANLTSSITTVTGDFVISGLQFTSEEVTLFPNLREVQGEVLVQTNNISMFSGLPGLETIGGNLTFRQNNITQGVSGFNSLREIGGDLLLDNNNLSSFSGFENLRDIGGDLTITDNDNMESIAGFTNISSLRNLTISINPNLIAIEGMNGALTVTGNLSISSNSALERITGFDNISTISGNMDIIGNIALQTLAGFEMLQQVNGDKLSIETNTVLNTIPSFNALRSIFGELRIEFNDLSALNGFNALEQLGGILITSEPGITELNAFNTVAQVNGDIVLSDMGVLEITGFQNLNRIDGRFSFVSFPDVQHLDFLSSVISIGGNLDINSCPRLNSMAGLNNVEMIDGDFSVSSLEALVDFVGPENLLEIGGKLMLTSNNSFQTITGFNTLQNADGISIQANSSLMRIEGFGALNSLEAELEISANSNLQEIANSFGSLALIGGSLLLSDMNSLTNISGFSNLATIRQNMVISRTQLASLGFLSALDQVENNLVLNLNPNLQNLNDLSGITFAVNTLEITRNEMLTDITGVQNIASINGTLTISRNTNLSACSIDLVCNHLSGGFASDIEFNSTDCNSGAEVLANCN